MGNLRNTQIGSFTGTVLFKVRRKSTGLFFKPEYRNPKWEQGGRAYSTLSAAMAAARSARERDGQGGTTLVPSSDIEIVEFNVLEVQSHQIA